MTQTPWWMKLKRAAFLFCHKSTDHCIAASFSPRESFPFCFYIAEGAVLADLYDPLTMPPILLKGHQTLDRAVDAAYGKTNFKTEAERVAFLFDLYSKYTSLFQPEKPKCRRG